MKIVIDIPDKVWNTAKEYGHLDICGIELSERVMNGTPYEERPKGEWIYEYDDFYHCSRCGHVICTEWDQLSFEKDFPFCHCGADMGGERKNE